MCGVFLSYSESWCGNIGGVDSRFREFFFDGDSDAARAGADIENDRGGRQAARRGSDAG